MPTTQANHNLTDANFDQTISQGLTLVDFWAPWCGPCRMQGPILEQVAQKIGDKAQICKLNVDENPQSAHKYGVMSIPTLIIYKDGQVAQQFVGVQSEQALVNALQELS